MYGYEDDFAWVEPMLRPGEKILWQGRPEKLRATRKADAFMIPFSIFWCGFAVFWEYNVIKIGAPVPFVLFGLFFVCIGLYISVGRFLARRFVAKRTTYAVTDQKILRRQYKKIDMQWLSTLPGISVETGEDGTGTILIGASSMNTSMRQIFWWTVLDTEFALRDIADVSEVLDIIETAKQAK